MKISVFALLLITLSVLVFGSYHYEKKIATVSAEASENMKEQEKIRQIERQEEINKFADSLRDVDGAINVKSGLKEDLINEETPTIVFLGDSTTEQNQYTKGKDGHVNLIHKALNPLSAVKVINSGISGDDSSDMLKRVESDVLRYNPDLVIVSTGINDAVNLTEEEIKKNLDTLLKRISEETEAKVIFRTSSATKDSNINERLENEINPLAKELSEKYKIGFADTYQYFSKQTADNFSNYMTDIYHPNHKGQKVIADYLISVLLLN
ncbi:hypothetical protein FGG79_09675 [Bacillus sp. BHET2]|uniref:SGNH/GDSL hydrolase family protein n=1 Tax=Bacillus sp. BHET2 TaxID=2583818 RepID=UPI00110F5777|nr:SGNH/GDSL hydrolase family protein [Bacillus sp. BHET2]TMU85483.1 hypothetical protein FGG79_09675 [Bacillus sp. BHET2]